MNNISYFLYCSMAESEELSNMSIHTSVNDVQVEFARQAKQEFEKQQYDNCISTMNKLTQNRTMDPKVIHNKGVAEFYQSKFTKIEEFKLCLSTVCHFVSIFIIFCMHYFYNGQEQGSLALGFQMAGGTPYEEKKVKLPCF